MAFPKHTRYRALIRDQARCLHCGISQRHADLEVHHIVPEARAGNDSLGNAATLCIECHLETHGHISTKSTSISDTDISEDVIEKILFRKTDLLKGRDEEIDGLNQKINQIRERLVDDNNRFDQIRKEHQLMTEVLWQQASPPVPAGASDSNDDSIDPDNESLFGGLISRIIAFGKSHRLRF